MAGRTAIYYSWSRPGETGAPLGVIENRFPTLFESRRMLYPRFAELNDPVVYDQGVTGFLDHIQRPNFVAFAELAAAETGSSTIEAERADDGGTVTPVTQLIDAGVDTLVIISFDSIRTAQQASEHEIAALRRFLDDPRNLLVVAPHHDIGDDPVAEFFHHGDRALPPEQRFGGYARSVLAGLGIPVRNRFGLRPALDDEGQPRAIEAERDLDRFGLLAGVGALNLHPHLPHLEREGEAVDKLDVLARQPIDLEAPPHAFVAEGNSTFDALLQSRREVFPGTVLVSDTTLFSSTAGGVESLTRLWTNLLGRAVPDT